MLYASGARNSVLDKARRVYDSNDEAGINTLLRTEHEQLRRADARIVHENGFVEIGTQLSV